MILQNESIGSTSLNLTKDNLFGSQKALDQLELSEPNESKENSYEIVMESLEGLKCNSSILGLESGILSTEGRIFTESNRSMHTLNPPHENISSKGQESTLAKFRRKNIMTSSSQRNLDTAANAKGSGKKIPGSSKTTLASNFASNQNTSQVLDVNKSKTPRIPQTTAVAASHSHKKSLTASKISKAEVPAAPDLANLSSLRQLDFALEFANSQLKKDSVGNSASKFKRESSALVIGQQNNSNILPSGSFTSIPEVDDGEKKVIKRHIKQSMSTTSEGFAVMQNFHPRNNSFHLNLELEATDETPQQKLELIQTLVREAHRETLQLSEMLLSTNNSMLDASILSAFASLSQQLAGARLSLDSSI
eukprot:TRINITY_DN6888_c0_g1_i1.p1 TRINITY_DN6888_c0_g1~~TRINITY_DN6888_c0_g1_i1.p1  ORF type:complete len:364 (-),score=33.52 TRINITY_DN6888_c0_g1_i1:94-1185(-)